MSAAFFAKHLAGSLFSGQRCESGNYCHPHFADEGAETQGDSDLLKFHMARKEWSKFNLSPWSPSLFPSPQTLTHGLNT